MMNFSDKRLSNHSFPPCDPLFTKLEILKIQDLFKLKLAKFIFNCLNGNNPINFSSWFILTSAIHNYSTRSKFVNIEKSISTRTLHKHRVRTMHYGLKSTKALGATIWNDLPTTLRKEDVPYSSFYVGLKKHFIRSYST